MKVFYSAFLGMPSSRKPMEQPVLIKCSMFVLAVFIVVIGIYPQVILKAIIEPAVNALINF